jgi:hypothetical protein
VAAGCGETSGLDDRACPCAEARGYYCCKVVDRCLPAGVACPDAGPEAGASDGRDAGGDEREAGTDAPPDFPADVADGPGDVPVDVVAADVPDGPPPACGPGFHIASDFRCHPILFSDDFEDGVVNPAWRLWRKTFAESGGRMNAGDSPREGFAYGETGNGRNAVLATHVGDPEWTDYRIDMDVMSGGVGAFNPENMMACATSFSIEFRLERAVESWNEPALTAYSLGVYIHTCADANAKLVGMDRLHDFYYPGVGRGPESGHSIGLTSATSSELMDGRPHHYAIEVVGRNIKLWINNAAVPVFDITDDRPYPAGTAPTRGGFQITWAWETLGWVDNVVVTDLRAGP